MKFIPAFMQNWNAHQPDLVNIITNIGWLFFDKALRLGVGLFVGVWMARYLGPEQFGLLNFITALVGLFGVLATLGLPSIVVRDLVYDPERYGEILGTAAILHLLASIVIYGLIVIAIIWIRPNDFLAKTLAMVMGTMVLFKVSEVAVYWFEAEVKSKYVVWCQSSVFLIFAAVKIVLILWNAAITAFAWVIAAEAAATAIIMLAVWGRRGPGFRHLHMRFSRVKSLLVNSWPLLLSSIAIMIYMRIDQVMLGKMVGDREVGIYAVAALISEVWYFVPMAIVASVFPAILKAKNQGESQYYKYFQHLYDLMVWLSIAVALPMTFLSTSIVKLLFGAEYIEAGQVLAIHIWASVFVFLGVASSRWFIADNRLSLIFQRAALGAIINVICNLLLIPDYGAIGAAWATVISYFVADMLADLLHRVTRKLFLMKARALNPVGVWVRIKEVSLINDSDDRGRE